MPTHIRRSFSCLLAASLLLAAVYPAPVRAGRPPAPPQAPAAAIHYVAPGGLGDCSSWAQACELQDALAQAAPGDQVWVAQGVYYPDMGGGQTPEDRGATFTLKAGVQIYGGFAGSETGLEQRDWQAHVTVLSGDIDGNDIIDAAGVITDAANIAGSNSFHVVSSASGITETARLDGFTVSGGKADNSYITNPCNQGCGGGMYNYMSNPSVANVIFEGNRGVYGGGMYNNTSAPRVSNVIFTGNRADYGAGMQNTSANPRLVGVSFRGNRASNQGGAVRSTYYSSPILTNVTILGNEAPNGGGIHISYYSTQSLAAVIISDNQAAYGGGIYQTTSVTSTLANVTIAANHANTGGGIFSEYSTSEVHNSLLWDNTTYSGPQVYLSSGSIVFTHSTIQDAFSSGSWNAALGTDGGGNLDADPLFVRSPAPGADGFWGTADDDYGDLRLQAASPAIDAGENSRVPADLLDLDGDGDLSEPLPYDLDGQPRFFNGIPPAVDMGAYEAQVAVVIPWITSHPADLSNDSTPTFTFFATGGSGGLSYQCLLDEASGGVWDDCTSPITYTTSLIDGPHNFQVKASDSMVSESRPPASFAWLIDATPPAVLLTGGPSDPTIQKSAVFTFTVSESAATYCALDQNPLANCTSPQSFTNLSLGDHTFSLLARDAAGNTGQVIYPWTVIKAIHLVRPGGVGDCSSWEDACDLQVALDKALPGDQIWAAEGVYKPGVNRDSTFYLDSPIALYGGFAGTETELSQRDWMAHPSILSGDVDGNDLNADSNFIAETWNDLRGANAYHVVVLATTANLDTRLDGFTITAGQANGSSGGLCGYQCGGGIYNPGIGPSLTNLIISGNQAYYGGGMWNRQSLPVLENLSFRGNKANYEGGGMLNYVSDLSLVNVTFNGNQASYGGGLYNDSSRSNLVNVTFCGNRAGGGGAVYTYAYDPNKSPTLTNVTFTNNHADNGGGIYSNSNNPKIRNTIFWENIATDGAQIYNRSSIHQTSRPLLSFSDIQDAFSNDGWNTAIGLNEGGNLDSAPLFVRNPSPGPDTTWGTADDDYGDLRLQVASPAIDAGDNSRVPPDVFDVDDDSDKNEPMPYDLDGGLRFFNGAPPIVDMGAYESQAVVPIVQITAQPTGLSTDATPTFAYTGYSGVGPLAYQCVMDDAGGSVWADCVSPITYTVPLTDGQHTFQVKASDSIGIQGRSTQYTWTIDTQPPVVQITGKPSNPSSDADSIFTFVNTGGGQGYQCKIDDAEWETCASPKEYSLPDGWHDFRVKSTDAAGNESAPASFIWIIDTQAPIVEITDKPTILSNDNTPVFTFGSPDGGQTYRCKLDSAAWMTCNSPRSYALADGQHTFQVKAIDAASNEGVPVSYTWTIDTQAPLVQIDSHPLTLTNQVTATFSFSGVALFRVDEVGALGYECRLDGPGADWQTCASPYSYVGLSDRTHTFDVRLWDDAGNTSLPASFTWKVDVTAPAIPSISGPIEGSAIPYTPTGWSKPVFSGQAEPGAIVNVYLRDNTLLCTAQVSANGAWNCTAGQALLAGMNRAYAVATDEAGNIGQATSERIFIIQGLNFLPVITK